MIERIELLHKAGYVHNDLKNDNLIVGKLPRGGLGRLRIIDFGTATKYQEEDGKHVAKDKEVIFKGNGLLNSWRVIRGFAPTRADDMMSIGLVMLYLIDGLPYQDTYFQMFNNHHPLRFQALSDAKEIFTPLMYCL